MSIYKDFYQPEKPDVYKPVSARTRKVFEENIAKCNANGNPGLAQKLIMWLKGIEERGVLADD